MREARGIECNVRVNDFRGLSKEIIDMGKELEREQGGGQIGPPSCPPRPRYTGMTPILVGQWDGLRDTSPIRSTPSIRSRMRRERYQMAEENFYQRMKDLGLRLDEKVQLVMSNLDRGRIILYEAGRCS